MKFRPLHDRVVVKRHRRPKRRQLAASSFRTPPRKTLAGRNHRGRSGPAVTDPAS